MSREATIIAQLKAAQTLGFDFIVYEEDEVHSVHKTSDEAMEAMIGLDAEGAEHGTVEVVFVNTGDVYATNGIPDDIEED